ncbi:uncharacterized protein EI90DRAFT_3065283 [Cantharellus anzutake]|uniref:uncharacterized protein n=1 Tax=Cantharellus anzutake TaxID=1750568 RepID=UPI00190812D0|nr:uncharacterized protein EI90DRAFT_3065283 [Cantharellus anzutake]KAF8328434.1 hypothetical protein EI90DRAFT_3065283 [Cantharellus anzutake]
MHKVDGLFEGSTVVLNARDYRFRHLPDLWLRDSGKIPTRSWFLGRLQEVITTGDVAGHSLRSGGATALALAGTPLERIRAIGRWSSEAFLIYLRQNPIHQPPLHQPLYMYKLRLASLAHNHTHCRSIRTVSTNSWTAHGTELISLSLIPFHVTNQVDPRAPQRRPSCSALSQCGWNKTDETLLRAQTWSQTSCGKRQVASGSEINSAPYPLPTCLRNRTTTSNW